MGRRLSRGANDRLMAVWTMSQEESLVDPGAGYNQRVDGSWGGSL